MKQDISAQRNIVARSDEFYKIGKLDRAIAELQPLIETGTEYFRPYYNTGFFHWLRAEYREAARYIEAAIERAPDFADARLLLGKSLLAQKHFARGLEALRAYSSLSGADRSALLWESRALWGLGREHEANSILLKYAEADGWSTPKVDSLVFSQEPWFLQHTAKWAERLKPIMGRVSNALEIGSMEGFSAVWIAEFLLRPEGRLTINDIEFRPNLIANLRRSRFSQKFAPKLGDSAEVLLTLPKSSFDFIYVDGDHSATGVFRDCVNAAILAAPGATVILDDYGKANETTKMGIDTFLSTIGRCFDVIEKDYQVFLKRRTEIVKVEDSDIKNICKVISGDSVAEFTSLSPNETLDYLRSGHAKIAPRN